MAAPLLDMAQRACIRHVMDLQDVGELSYKVIRPVLKSVTNPAQLRQIEEASPHIAEDDAELWEAFIRRDISKAESRLKTTRPRNPSSWWKVYRKLKREDETETKAAEEKLKAALNRHKVDKGSKQTNIVRAVIPSGEKRTGWSAGPKEKPFGAQALKNAKTAADTITILKRQTAQRQAGRSVAQSTPMHQLQQMRGKVAQAPAHMIRQYAQKPGPSRPAPIAPQPQAYRPVFASKPQTQADRALREEIAGPDEWTLDEQAQTYGSGSTGTSTSSNTRGNCSTKKIITHTSAETIASPPNIWFQSGEEENSLRSVLAGQEKKTLKVYRSSEKEYGTYGS
ncbi:hypothetical protein D6D12_05015 [Aureobasidium pullulans]|uniref:RNA polymerase II transcription factor SIII subunit A n=1 Tax=Aureobasidium pullulans TaxID=5580 RepID=A0AB74JUD8_AURPU|nr:hypothetical protein D6D12_05015 [Aureobasidium pullulans]THX64518.1 hypothetical protein D6D11_01106 [Aureobasidium pullulans]